MKLFSFSILGLMVLAPVVSLRATALTLVGSEGAASWGLADDFEGLSYYGTTGVTGVTPVAQPLSVLGGLGTLSLSSGRLVVYGNAPAGAGAASGSGIPTTSADYPGFQLNGGYAGTALSSSRALGVDAASSKVTIQFSQAVDAFAFYGAADMKSAFSVSLFDTGGALIDSSIDLFGQPTSLSFWGLQSPVGIGRVEISGSYLALDRLLVQGRGLPQPPPAVPPAVPEVATVAPALGAVLFGVELMRRRRR